MKKVSQMLIQNLTVFVQQATKLQMDQVVLPDLNKHNEWLMSLEKKLSGVNKQLEKLAKDSQSQAQVLLKNQDKIKDIIHKQAAINSTMSSSK